MIWSFLILFLLQPSAQAEYRVFQLQITDTQTGKERQVQSTMDHIQYPRYYPLAKDETITLVDSWMCWENTNNFRPACQKLPPLAGPLSQ